jgi:uncharacterized protein YbcI
MPDDARTAAAPTGNGTLARISGAMVHLYKEQFGRGPTRVRTDWAGPDTLITQLWDTLTPVERSMARMDEHERLREVRMLFQHASEEEFCRPVEEATGRKVVAFLSGIDTKADVSMECFVLAAAGGTEPA